jgi:hypothetical protein
LRCDASIKAETLNNSIFPIVCARCCRISQPGVPVSDASNEAKMSDDDGRQTTPILWASAIESICMNIVVRLNISLSERRPRLGRISNSPRIFSRSAAVFCSVIARKDFGGDIKTASGPAWLSRHPLKQTTRQSRIRSFIFRRSTQISHARRAGQPALLKYGAMLSGDDMDDSGETKGAALWLLVRLSVRGDSIEKTDNCAGKWEEH